MPHRPFTPTRVVALPLILFGSLTVLSSVWAEDPLAPPVAKSSGVEGLTRSKVLKETADPFSHLEEIDPYRVSQYAPRLLTPQWIGEPGVDAVIILSIDDLGDPVKYEQYLRPILERLKKIDGRAALSITANRLDSQHPQLQKWLAEGVNLETHTTKHACPMLAGGDLAATKADYDQCVDLLHSVPNNRPAAFRVPCCDSMNATSPRFFSEVFGKTTPNGRFVTIDSSVFNLFTSNDPAFPRDLVVDPNGVDRFRKYIPFDRSFANWVEDYPYPYVIGRLCWEFPCVMPSYWDGQNRNQPFSPFTVADLEAAIDATVLKQGVFTFVFHPHGWIRNDQVVELIDHAEEKYGKQVKFLNFREAQDALDKNLLLEQPIRAADGGDNGVRLADLNADGCMDVVIGNENLQMSRVWSPSAGSWSDASFPTRLVETSADGKRIDAGVKFGAFKRGEGAFALLANERSRGAWRLERDSWREDPTLLAGLVLNDQPLVFTRNGVDQGVRLRDLDGDGASELLVAGPGGSAVFRWNSASRSWSKLPWTFPDGVAFSTPEGGDAGLRLFDFDEDGRQDVLFSNEERYSLHLFDSMETGWARPALAGIRSASAASGLELPPVAVNGTNNGAWFHSRTLWLQNEHTAKLPDKVDRRAFNDLLAKVKPRSREARASLLAMHPRPGFEVELVAAEPLVMDPIAFDWGADGSLWVVEMADYPEGIDGEGKPGGRIRRLIDTDGDGRYDTAHLFLEGLSYPTSAMPWRDGVLVTCSPDLFYAVDRDGDGRAEEREALYTGFGSLNPQHLVNGLTYGLDGWVYLANGDSGGQIRSVKTGEEVSLRHRDLRVHPDSGRLEAIEGQTQFSRAMDDWGNWFGCANPRPMWHYVLSDHYLERNPHVAAPNFRVDVSVAPGPSPVFPTSRTQERFNDPWMVDRFTSACGVMVYRDTLLGPTYVGNSFVCEPVHNLVHREVMSASGVTFTSRRAPDEIDSEFLSSRDNYLRPTWVRTGPDGALWVADMHRAHIEHPEYVPEELQEGVNFRAGEDRGRIYRVYPPAARPRPAPRLDRMSTAELVTSLGSANGWIRDTAARLLHHRQDPEAPPLLRKLFGESSLPQARMQALCALANQDALPVEDLERALGDTHPGVRRESIRLSEGMLSKSPALQAKLLAMTEDGDPRTRLQLACTLGEWGAPEAGAALGRLASKDGRDRFALAAILSSVTGTNLMEVLSTALGPENPAPPTALVEGLTQVAAALEREDAIERILAALHSTVRRLPLNRKLDCLGAVISALEERDRSLESLRENSGAGIKSEIAKLTPLLAEARKLAASEEASTGDRLAAIRLLGHDSQTREADLSTLFALLDPKNPPETQRESLEALARLEEESTPGRIISAWSGFGPEVRSRALDLALSREGWTQRLLEALEGGSIPVGHVDAAHRQLLLDHEQDRIRARAEQVFETSVGGDREAVVQAYREAENLPGDSEHGSALFKERCATCHALHGMGRSVGADLSALTDKSPKALLVSILDPNRSVETKFYSYVAETLDGLTLSGLLVDESGNSVTLVSADGTDNVVLRGDLESFRATNKSFMPDGLEAGLSPQDLADLCAFVGGGAERPKRFSGNEPKVIVPEKFRGELWLMATDAEIYGDTLILEDRYKNLGKWLSGNDRALWTLELAEPGEFVVVLDYACEDSSAGNPFDLSVGENRLAGKVKGTGTADTYDQAVIGRVELGSGRHRLVFRSGGPLRGELLDLRAIGLRPARLYGR
ncbi:MAG: VCBS repeat-containing protein [Candidatus Omnitrophica bacterium]|nr:VCBS repeat-containing protein [Candidatus Omnitrophota bacterium]